MTFHDFGPWRASKIMPARRRFMTADFYSKNQARIKNTPSSGQLSPAQLSPAQLNQA